MLARFKAWVRARLPTWAQLLLLSRTMAGLLLMALGFAAEHVSEVQGFAVAVGLPSWAPIALGFSLAFYARARDAYTGANRP